MIAFFITLAVLMVLVVALGSGWARPPRRPHRGVVIDRGPDVIERGPDVVEEAVYEDPAPRPIGRARRVVRRRRY